MVRKIIKIAVFLLIANAVYQIAPVALHHFEFKDALQELVLYAQKAPDAEIVDRAMALAAENHVPLDRDDVRVRRETGTVHIEASYVEYMHFLPGHSYPWEFDIDAKALDIAGAAPRR